MNEALNPYRPPRCDGHLTPNSPRRVSSWRALREWVLLFLATTAGATVAAIFTLEGALLRQLSGIDKGGYSLIFVSLACLGIVIVCALKSNTLFVRGIACFICVGILVHLGRIMLLVWYFRNLSGGTTFGQLLG